MAAMSQRGKMTSTPPELKPDDQSSNFIFLFLLVLFCFLFLLFAYHLQHLF